MCSRGSVEGEALVLTALAVVCSQRKELPGLPHVLQTISSFLDSISGRWTLEAVSKSSEHEEHSSVRLLDRLLTREWSGLSEDVRMDRFLNGVEQAFGNNKMQIVDWWLTKYLPVKDSTVEAIMKCASGCNRIHVLAELERKRALPIPNEQLRVECRHADAAYWLHERGYSLSIDVRTEIRRINLKFTKWVYDHEEIHARGFEDGIAIANERNRVEMAQWLLDTFPDTHWLLPSATGEAGLEMIKWINEKFPWGERLDMDNIADVVDRMLWVKCSFQDAASSGRLEIAQYLYGHHLCFASRDLVISVADYVQYYGDRRLFLTRDDALNSAAEHGHIEVVKWLYKDSTFSEEALAFAAKGGHFEILQWLHNAVGATSENAHMRFRFGERVVNAMDEAASEGYLDIVQWLHANRSEGCTAEALKGAARRGHLELVQWLVAHRPECADSVSPELMDLAAEHGRLEIVQWLHGSRMEGCTAKAVDKAAEEGHLDVVKFLIENRSEGCTTAAVDGAASGGHLEIVKCLLASRFACCTSRAMDNAIVGGHYALVIWLRNNHPQGHASE